MAKAKAVKSETPAAPETHLFQVTRGYRQFREAGEVAKRLVHPGVYIVPQDLSIELAQEIEEAGCGHEMAAPDDLEPTSSDAALMGKPRKKQDAPENKARGDAPEDK